MLCVVNAEDELQRESKLSDPPVKPGDDNVAGAAYERLSERMKQMDTKMAVSFRQR